MSVRVAARRVRCEDPRQETIEFRARGGCARARRAAAHPHHNIDSPQTVAQYAERFPHQPLRPVPVDRPRHRFLADNDTEARVALAIRHGKHGEVAARCGRPRSERRRKLLAVLQPRRARQAGFRGDRGAQTLNRARPLARRARNTERPPRVRMRTRNPWVRLRRVTDG